jgi:hypothetical protein
MRQKSTIPASDSQQTHNKAINIEYDVWRAECAPSFHTPELKVGGLTCQAK